MGNSSGKPPLPTELSPIKDPRYGGNALINLNRTRIYQLFDIDHTNIDDFTNLLTSRRQLSHPNLLTVNKTWVDDYREDCSLQKMYRVMVEYTYMPKTLQDEIRKYCDLQMPMPEQIVRKYFGEVVSCLEYLAQKGTYHGDVKPRNIIIDNNKAYLTDSYFANGGRIAYQIVIEDPESLSLLSPAQLESLRNKKFVSLRQVHRDEIFQVGLSMIEAMTAQPAMECYDLGNLKLKPAFFEGKYREMLSYSYSNQLCELVMRCVEPVTDRRPKFADFLQNIYAGVPRTM